MENEFDIMSQVGKNLSAKKVGIVEFCESSDYCSKRLYPKQRLLLKLIFLEELTGREEDYLDEIIEGGRDGREVFISPGIRERMDFLRDQDYPHFREIVLVGGRRSSKGFITGLALAKVMYDVLLLQDPGLHFGIDPSKEIYFSCIASSLEQAKKFQYADFSTTVNGCASMEEYIYKMQELEFSVMTENDKMKLATHRSGKRGGQSRDMSKLRGNALAANASTLRGSATMAIAFDEMAHMQQEGESAQTANMVYEAAVPSLAQFGKAAILFCNSSPYTKIGKFYQRYEEACKLGEDGSPFNPTMFTFQFPSWYLFSDYQDESPRRFRQVITASPDWDTEEKGPDGKDWWSEEDKNRIQQMRRDEASKEEFGVEYRAQWAEVIDAFLRPESVDKALEGRPNRDGSRSKMKVNWDNANYEYRYKAHLDPSSTTDGFGFAMGHIEELEHFDDKTGKVTWKPHVMMDIVQRWKPKDFPGGAIDWEVVLNEVTMKIQIFRPYEVTFDMFQSSAPIQWLNKWLRDKNMADIRVYERPSTSQYNYNRAMNFRTSLYSDFVHLPSDTSDATFAADELKNLQMINTAGRFPRIHHQDIGPVQTDDMAVCIMEVVDSLIGNIVASEIRHGLAEMHPVFGSSGGYRIGGAAGDKLAQIYSGSKGMNNFSEMREINDASGTRVSAARNKLDKLAASRSGTWNSRNRRSGGSGSRGRGY